MKRFGVAMLLVLASGQGFGQEANQVWEEAGKRVARSGTVNALGPDLFGDQVSLSNGALSFSVTDVSVPGNSDLPVAFTRIFSVRPRKGSYVNAEFPLADWEIDLPNISGVFAPDWVSAIADTPGKRCSVTTVAGARPPVIPVGTEYFHPRDYWQGHNLSLPTGGGEMLLLDPSRPRPSTGGPYYWITADQTRIACLSSIKNWSGGGEGFLAVAPDGTRYWFDWMAQDLEPVLESSTTIEVLGVPKTYPIRRARRRNVLYPTRVEDRFGNWVTYTYTNARTAPLRLTSIRSSDARRIDINYNAEGYVGSVVAHGKTWKYQYANANSVDKTLSSVVLPDTSQWTIDFSGLLNSRIEYVQGPPSEPWRTCTRHPDVMAPHSFAGRVTHPSGAVGDFKVKVQSHGRTNVPLNCLNFTAPHNYENDDVSFWTISYHALSLAEKKISGPGLTAGTWTYAYGSPSSYYKPGGDSPYPVCPPTMDCSIPRCTSDDCAGSSRTTVTDPAGNWTRYHHGNSYRYNEGKLLKVEEGKGSSVLRTSWSIHDLTQLDHEYPAKWGTSPRMDGGGFASEYHRPLLRRVVVQDGGNFDYRVSAFDAFARPVHVERSSVASNGGIDPVPPTGAPALTAPAASNNGKFTVSWTTVSNATSYQLYQRPGGGSWARVYNGAAASKAISGLGAGSYGYRVRACNAEGCTGYSAVQTTVVTLPPTSVPALTVPTTSNGAHTVSWTAVGTATSYQLDQRKDGGSWSRIYGSAGRSKAISGLANGSYGYRVRACNAGGCSGYSAIKTSTVTLSPIAAPSLSVPATAPTTNQAYTVRWGAVANATAYELQRNRNNAGWTTIYNGGAVYRSETQRYDGTYVYRVRACNSGGCSVYSTSKTVVVRPGGGGGGCGGGFCPDPKVVAPVVPLTGSAPDEEETR